MLVEDVFLSEENTSSNKSGEECFRRLVFRRNPNLIQSEALVVRVKTSPKAEEKGKNVGGTGRKHPNKKKGKPAKDSGLTQKQGSPWALRDGEAFTCTSNYLCLSCKSMSFASTRRASHYVQYGCSLCRPEVNFSTILKKIKDIQEIFLSGL